MTCRVCTRRNSQCIDDETDTTNNATTTTYHATKDNPQHDKQPHHTTPLTNTHTNTYQQTHRTSFPTSVVLLGIHDKLLVAYQRRAFTTRPPSLPSSLPLHLHNIASCDPATHSNATEHLSIFSANSSPLLWVCTRKTRPMRGANFSPNNERAKVHALWHQGHRERRLNE